MQQYNRRNYQRGKHLHCNVEVSSDNKIWYKANTTDVSSGGLSLQTTQVYEVGDSLQFSLEVESFLSQFTVKTEGKVRRKEIFAKEYIYGIEFINLHQDIKIRIDESVLADRPIGRETYENDH